MEKINTVTISLDKYNYLRDIDEKINNGNYSYRVRGVHGSFFITKDKQVSALANQIKKLEEEIDDQNNEIRELKSELKQKFSLKALLKFWFN